MQAALSDLRLRLLGCEACRAVPWRIAGEIRGEKTEVRLVYLGVAHSNGFSILGRPNMNQSLNHDFGEQSWAKVTLWGVLFRSQSPKLPWPPCIGNSRCRSGPKWHRSLNGECGSGANNEWFSCGIHVFIFYLPPPKGKPQETPVYHMTEQMKVPPLGFQARCHHGLQPHCTLP